MKKKLLVGLANVVFLFGVVSTVNATSLVMNPNVTTQLGGISEIDINGTLWDATFYNQWSMTPNEEVYDFAEAASSALYNTFNTFAPLTTYKDNPQTIWGIENIGAGSKLFTPSLMNS